MPEINTIDTPELTREETDFFKSMNRSPAEPKEKTVAEARAEFFGANILAHPEIVARRNRLRDMQVAVACECRTEPSKALREIRMAEWLMLGEIIKMFEVRADVEN